MAGNRSVGLLSPPEERQALYEVADSLKSSSYNSQTAHKVGRHAASVRQQVDKTALNSRFHSLQRGATAIDTAHFPRGLECEPGVRVMIFILDELSENAVSGGNKSQAAFRAKTPEFLLLIHSSRYDLKPVMTAYKECIETKGKTNKFIFRPFVADENGYPIRCSCPGE